MTNPQRIIDLIPAMAWSARPDGRGEFFNQHYLDFIGLSGEQAADWGWTAAVHPDDLEDFTAACQIKLAAQAAFEGELRLRRHDGEYRWFLFRAQPHRDEHGRISAWVGVNTDITDLKRTAAELRHAYTALARVSRVTTLNALTATIAHEVNQPLSGILTNAGTCLRMLDANPPNVTGARETARRTIRDGNRAADVLAKLRALLSNRDFTLETTDLNDAAREVIALSVDAAKRHHIAVQSDLAADLPAVSGDRIQLQQVMLNMMLNAVEAMADVPDRPRRLQFSTALEDREHVRVTVQDTGVGLPAGPANSIFDAFYTTKSGGMGIGLFVSRSIIERHHGRLWAQPNDGPGATVAFSIPLHTDEADDIHVRTA